MARAKLLQFVAPKGRMAIWHPATEGLWLWSRINEVSFRVGGAIGMLVRGLGPREDFAMCLPVERAADGTLKADTSQGAAGNVKSCRELPAGYWTFLRPLQEGDPEIPGA